jgi:hypothetical protein
VADQEITNKLTIAEFAARIKQRAPELESVPDDQLVRKVLERRPEMINFIQTSEQRPPMGGLTGAVARRFKSDLNPLGTIDYVGQLLNAVNKPPYAHGGGLKAMGESLKSTYSKPENLIGDALAMMLMNKTGEGPEPIKSAAKDITATTLQRFAGAGREPVLIEQMVRELQIAKRAERFEKAKLEVEKSNQNILQQHSNKVNEAYAKYQKEMDDYNQSGAQNKSEHAEKVNQARREWVERSAQSKAAERESQKVENRKATLERSQSEYGERLQKNLKDTYQTVKSRLDSRWHKLRTTPTQKGGALGILNDELGNAKDLQSGMKTAEEKFLHGSPGSVRQFRDLAGWIERGDWGLKDPTWDELRTHYSALGDAIYGRPVPPNVLRALRFMRDDVIGSQLNSMAGKAGVGEDYTSLLKDHSQFESDWRDMHSVTRAGGSPLAVALKAPNAASLIPQITGKTGDILIERLAKYTDAGASPGTASAIRKLDTEVNNLPKVRVPAAPGKFEPPAESKLGEPPELKLPKAPNLKTAKPPDPVHPIDPVAVRRQRILEYTSRPKSAYDYLPPRVFTEPLLSNKTIREWVAKYPRKEFPVPSTIRTAPIRETTSVPKAPSAAEPFIDMATRRGPGEPGPAVKAQILQGQLDSLRLQLKQQLASRDPAYWNTRNKLQDVEAQYKSLFGSGSSSPTMTSSGGGGANYSADQLAEFKRKHGIQ